MGETLKPCPFCGGKAMFECNLHGWIVLCGERAGKCQVESRTLYFTTAQGAFDAWNTRAGDLIPRDEITPQMAAEVLLNSFGDYMPLAPKIAAIKEHTLHDGKCRPTTVVAGIRAALTAIKESKDD